MPVPNTFESLRREFSTLGLQRGMTISRFPIIHNGERVWVEKPDMAHDNGVHFPVVGSQFAKACATSAGRVGNADALLFSTRALVDFAKAYFSRTLVPE